LQAKFWHYIDGALLISILGVIGDYQNSPSLGLPSQHLGFFMRNFGCVPKNQVSSLQRYKKLFSPHCSPAEKNEKRTIRSCSVDEKFT
jgi:hypothetical protein